MKIDYVTIDLEGDALSRDINKKIFPEGGHYDPETRLWCMTMYNGDRNITYVCKLPEEPRKLPNGRKTKAVHYSGTKVPSMIDKYNIHSFNDYADFINSIHKLIENARNYGFKVFFRGYGNYDYDKDMLEMKFKEMSLNTDILDCMVNINKHMRIEWPKTSAQVTTGKWMDNQEYMIHGIRHNIEDSIQLYNLIKENKHV